MNLTVMIPTPALQIRAQRRTNEPALRFAPLAWLKLRLFLHSDDTEVGFFGISSQDDLLYIEDLVVPKQTVSAVTVSFDDAAVADHFETCAEAGIPPARCGRLWIHTHPGSSPNPSRVDEETFDRAFGNCDWAVMAIVARGGKTYARLRFNAGPGGSTIIPIEVDWERLPKDLLEREGSLDELFGGWMDEYGQKVHPRETALRGLVATQEPMLESTPAPRVRSYLDQPDPVDELYDQRWIDEHYADLYFDSELELEALQ